MKKVIVYTHSDCLVKENGLNHPEKKERLQVIFKSIPVFPQEHEYYLTPTHMHKKTRLNQLVFITIKNKSDSRHR